MEREGFTLIELLVVVSIVAVLLTIGVPVPQKSKEKGKDIVCTNNLRQLNFGISVYSQDNESYPYGFFNIPGYSNKVGDSTKDWQSGLWWFQFFNGIAENSGEKNGPLWCPSRRLLSSNTFVSNNVLCGNYGINYSICKITQGTSAGFSGNPLRVHQVRSPFSKLLLMDSGYTLISWKALTPNPSFENSGRLSSYYLPGLSLNNNRTINPFQQRDATNGRHSSRKFNTAFADGHVDKKKPSSVVPTIDSSGNVLKNSSWLP